MTLRPTTSYLAQVALYDVQMGYFKALAFDLYNLYKRSKSDFAHVKRLVLEEVFKEPDRYSYLGKHLTLLAMAAAKAPDSVVFARLCDDLPN